MKRLNLGGCLVTAVLAAALAGAGQAPGPSLAGDSAAGLDVYSVRCAFCHGDQAAGGQGPTLLGVVGRKAGSVPGFAYTDAMTHVGLAWTPERLDRFLADPSTAVPGTAMPMSVPDPTERRNLIAYLGSLH